MSEKTVVINVEYFNGLAARYRSNFSAVDSAITYAKKTQNVGLTSFDLFKFYASVIKDYHTSFEYDITCISSVFAEADEEMRKRAEELIGKDIIDRVSNGESIVVTYYNLKPDLKEPRQLDHTQYGYTTDKGGNLVYDHPEELEEYLYRDQGSAYPNTITGTCGLCACANILRMAGVNYDEKQMVDYAVEHGLCGTGDPNPGANGGTFNSDIQELLTSHGVPAHTESTPSVGGYCTKETIDKIASNVENGKGVVIGVWAYALWPNKSGARDGAHAIVVTSVVKDSAGNINGFYVCDSNANKPSYYSADKLQNALMDDGMVVTDSPIR